jgi:hypothetical protein
MRGADKDTYRDIGKQEVLISWFRSKWEAVNIAYPISKKSTY